MTLIPRPKSPLQEQVEQETGMKIVKIADRTQLGEILDKSLTSLYIDIFAQAPYFEKFEEKEVRDYFLGIFDSKGTIMIAFDGDKLAAFVASQPLSSKKGITPDVQGYLTESETAYFAEDGVTPEYRRRGLSDKMKSLLLEENRAEGYKKTLLRTSAESYNQISAVNKAGGRVLSGVFQDVAAKRTNGTISKDKRVFYLFDLAPDPYQVPEVTIVRGKGGKDIAYIANVPEDMPLYELEREIRACYPNIKKIVLAPVNENKIDPNSVLMKGKLYTNKSATAKPRPQPPITFMWGPGF